MGHGHELPEDLLRRVAAFCLVSEALLLRGVCELWKAAFPMRRLPHLAWYVQLAWQRAWCKEVAAFAQTAVYPCTRALVASSKEVWRIFTMADLFVTAPHGPVRIVMAQRLTLDGNQNLWLLSYLFHVDCRYVDVLQARMVEGRRVVRSLRRVVARKPGLPPGARRAEGCDGRWQEAFHDEEFLRSPQRRALAAIGKCGPGAYNWDGCVRVNRGASPLQWGPWILHSGGSRKSAALQLSHFPTGATLILGVGGLPVWPPETTGLWTPR